MEIDGKRISDYIASLIRKDLRSRKKKKTLQLVAFLISDSSDQMSFVRIKSKVAKKLGINFHLEHMKSVPSFEKFAHVIKQFSQSEDSTGLLIQQPLPAQLSTESLYDYIPQFKEIEGHRRKSPFLPPLGLAVLTVLKYIYGKQKLDPDIFVNFKKDRRFFKKIFRNKKVVLVGRGITGGKPIGKTLNEARINYIGINSKTPDAASYYRDADIIITAVGRKIITKDVIKPGVVLINVGLRHEKGKLKGDYDEKEIKDIASFYTPTPGGVGPIDVIYLYKNLIDAAKLQK